MNGLIAGDNATNGQGLRIPTEAAKATGREAFDGIDGRLRPRTQPVAIVISDMFMFSTDEFELVSCTVSFPEARAR